MLLTPQDREKFAQLIRLSDGLIGGQNQFELARRINNALEALSAKQQNQVKETGQFDPGSSRLAWDVEGTRKYLKPEEIQRRQTQEEIHLLRLADNLPAITRCLAADRLANSSDPGDKNKAAELLTEIIDKHPSFIIDLPADSLPLYTVRNAINNSNALDNQRFMAAYHRMSRNLGYRDDYADSLLRNFVKAQTAPADKPQNIPQPPAPQLPR